MNGVVTWFSTWLLVFVGIALLARTSWGRPIVYGLIWLAILLLVLAHADEINTIFNVNALNLNG